MKEGWQVKKLGEVCDVIGGGTPSKDNVNFYSGTIPWATVRDMRYDLIVETECRITEAAVKNSATNIIPSGNVVIATRVGLGKVCVLNQDTAINQDLRGIIPKDDKKIAIRYLFWWLKSIADVIVSEGSGATVQGVKLPFVKSLEIPLPFLPEQQRIVALLDEAFEAIATAKAHAEQNLKNARALFESQLDAVFRQRGEGWVEKRLGDVFDIGSSKRILESEWTTSGVPFFGGKEIVKLAKFGMVVSNAYISEEKYRDYASKYDMPRRGDILITARGTIGVGYVVQENDKFYYKDGNIISMRARFPTNPNFILYAFRSTAMIDQFDSLSGTTVKHLPIEKAKSLLLAMPSFPVQNSFVEKIQIIEEESQHLEGLYRRKIAALDELKASLLHKAFAGEL